MACGCGRRGALLALAGGGAALAGCAGDGGLGAALVDEAEVDRLGLAAFEEIKAKTPVLDDPAARARVERVGRRILAASGSDIPASRWEFVVFDAPEANAFALPGGKVGVYRGMFPVARDDAGLATVLGHEIGHVLAEHPARRVGTGRLAELGVALSGALLQLGGIEGGEELAGLLGVGAQYGVVLPFSRAQELEADRLGVGYMARAGYDPEASIAFWTRMAQAGGGRGGPGFLSTHPTDAARIAQLEAIVPGARRAAG